MKLQDIINNIIWNLDALKFHKDELYFNFGDFRIAVDKFNYIIDFDYFSWGIHNCTIDAKVSGDFLNHLNDKFFGQDVFQKIDIHVSNGMIFRDAYIQKITIIDSNYETDIHNIEMVIGADFIENVHI